MLESFRVFRMTTPLFAALLLGPSLLSAGTAYAQTASTPPHLPDLSAYSCASVSAQPQTNTRHIGQVIKGIYNEWNEIYGVNGDQQHLICVSLMRPSLKQLSAAEVQTFLTDSLNVGAPALAGPDRQQVLPQGILEKPENIPAEPMKRLRKSPPASPASGEQKSNAAEELPPLPAAKNFDTGTTTPVLPPQHGSAIAPAGASLNSRETPATVGTEDRAITSNTQTYPWNTVAYLSATYPSGDSYRCSATVVSAYVVVTAGHCVHNNARGGFISSARVYPGQNQQTLGDNTPLRFYGVKSDLQAAQTTSQWAQIADQDSYLVSEYKNDMGALEFKTPFTYTSTFMPILYGSLNSPITSVGYPAEYKSQAAYGQYADTGNETSESTSQGFHAQHVRAFAVDASGGNSGGPFIYTDPLTNQRYLVGSLSYGEDLDDDSGGPWYESYNQSLLSGWVSWTPNTVTAGSVSGLRAASIFGSIQSNLVSYLRFYNSGTSAGTVDVTLADYATGTVLATWTSPSLAGGSSRQFGIDEIESNANATFTKPAIYSISVRPTFTGSFQNALWRKLDATLTNLSTCDTQSTNQKVLINVHSSLLQSGYPAAVVVHNTASTAVSVNLGMYNAQDGQKMGTYFTSSIPANAQKVVAVSDMEKAAGFSPGNTVYHYVIKAETNFTGYLQHLLNNQAAGIVTDMTPTCSLTP